MERRCRRKSRPRESPAVNRPRRTKEARFVTISKSVPRVLYLPQVLNVKKPHFGVILFWEKGSSWSWLVYLLDQEHERFLTRQQREVQTKFVLLRIQLSEQFQHTHSASIWILIWASRTVWSTLTLRRLQIITSWIRNICGNLSRARANLLAEKQIVKIE